MRGQEFEGLFSILPKKLGVHLSTFGGSGRRTFFLILEVAVGEHQSNFGSSGILSVCQSNKVGPN